MWQSYAFAGTVAFLKSVRRCDVASSVIAGRMPVKSARAAQQNKPKNSKSGSAAHVFAATFAILTAGGADVTLVEPARAEGHIVDAGPAGKAGRYSGVIKRAAVIVKQSQVIDVDQPYATALVAEAEIADVVPLSDRSIYVVGKKVGTTRLTVVGENQKILRIVEVEVTPDTGDLSAKLREGLPGSNIRVSSVNGAVVLTGVVHDAPTIERALSIAKHYAPEVTNALSVASPQQVMLEVRFVEASRSAGRELGISTRGRGTDAIWDTSNQIFGPATGSALPAAALLSNAVPFGTLVANVIEQGVKVDAVIRALEERSIARRLAEPNLITTSGDTASFLAGGEFPFPVPASQGNITIEFKQFGVALAFTPTVLADGLINLKIAPEVSDVDPNRSITVGGITVPGLVVRRANTTVELKDGQALAIAGLLQHVHAKDQAQLPWIGSVPVLGALFRSANFQNSETDLVIIVTPRLVKPARPGEHIATPLEEPIASNDVDFFANGRAEISKEDLDRRRDVKPYGHIIETGAERVSHASAK